jgi:tetratricopeptide (TPR) repeat protein
MDGMDQQSKTFYELRFRAQFLESKAAAFQDLFVAIMSKAYPGDFIPCRPWGSIGDRKNDGYLKSDRTLFQVYAPNEMRMTDTVSKIVTDFSEALPHWHDYFDTWVFVHNAHGGLPPDVIAKLLELEQSHAPIKVTQWGFEELLLHFRRLPADALTSLYGSLPPGAATDKRSEVKSKTKLAQELLRDGKHTEGMAAMTEALAIARAEGDDEKEVEILSGLALLSSDRRGRGDRQHYFQQAEKKVATLKSSVAKVIYLRARAGACEEKRDFAGAEEAYTAALECCSNEPEDDKNNVGIQGCIVRSSFVHFLCGQKRLEEAQSHLTECETYARNNKDFEEGELLQAALEAGIHFSFEAGDEDSSILRITELESLASTSRLATRIGGDLVNIANRASHRDFHRAALAAAEASIRLGRRSGLPPEFLAGALYTEAMVIMKAGNDEEALIKAEALLDLCHRPEDAVIKQAVNHLLAEIRRCSGDSQTAVDLARLALNTARGGPEEVAFAKSALARALNDNGQAEDALKQAKEAWTLVRSTDIPAEASIQFLNQITNYASQLGAETDVKDAISALDQLPKEREELNAEKLRVVARAYANWRLRQRLLEVMQEKEPATTAGTANCKSLPEANAVVVRPLLRLWDEASPESTGGMYDFWGTRQLRADADEHAQLPEQLQRHPGGSQPR